MDILLALVQLGAGLGALALGGHYLVEGATRIAFLARVSAAVVGLTVVALGTSMPEMAVSVGAALRDASDISYANVVGSNIFNIAVILALAATLQPLPVPPRTIRLEYPFMVGASVVALLVVRDGAIDRLEGAVFVAALVSFLIYVVHLARREGDSPAARELQRHHASRRFAWTKSLLMVGAGIVGLAGGAELMVRGAITLAEIWGVSQRVIGLTIVAMGTSLPELATCVVAARRDEGDILLGNIVGSNIFNVLGILGVTGLLVRVSVDAAAVAVDNWVMIAFAVGLFPLMAWGRMVTRANGMLLLMGFLTYMGYLAATAVR